MAQKKTSQKPIAREEYTTNKVLAVFASCLVGVIILMLLQRLLDYGNTFRAGLYVCQALIVVAAAIVIWGAVLFYQERNGKRSAENRIICGRNVLFVGVVSVLMLTTINYFGSSQIMKPFYVLLPALAIYYLIFHSYSREFFWLSTDCGVALAAYWLIHRWQVNGHAAMRGYLIVGALAVLAALQIALTLRHKRLPKAKIKKGLSFSRNAYTLLMATPIMLTLVGLALSIVGTGAYMVCMIIAGAYFFAATVYYTVKMM